jgi:poly-gamma-glutamate capsule biosynthesis protein CapA/YwtB (metallophosphatase superfamily)
MKRNNFFNVTLLASCFILFLFVIVSFLPIRSFQPLKTSSHIIPNFFRAEPTESKPEKTTILFTGDVMLGRTVEISAQENKDFTYPFTKVADVLKSQDITFINLENPIVEKCPPHRGGFTFCASPSMLEGLVYSGVDIVTLANNHTQNYGTDGILQTKKFLDQRNISYTGSGNLVTKEVNGVTFGFLGFDKAQQGNPKLTAFEENLITESNSKVDVLIVAMHWGVEYKNKALPGVRNLARELVEKGADVVIGAHPHWVQNREYFDNEGNSLLEIASQFTPRNDDWDKITPVYYSLGNFVFDQMWSEETRKGLAVKLTFEGKNIVNEELLPIYMKRNGQPEWVTTP